MTVETNLTEVRPVKEILQRLDWLREKRERCEKEQQVLSIEIMLLRWVLKSEEGEHIIAEAVYDR